MSLKAVIFDLDGTLYESRQFPLRLILAHPSYMFILKSERICRKKLNGVPFKSAEEYYCALFSLMHKDCGISIEKAEDWFWNIYMPDMERIIRTKFHCQDRAAELIAKLKNNGIKVAVLSDYPRIAEKLRACGLSADSFDAVHDSQTLGGMKPCKETFLNMCNILGVEPSETMMVGDKVATDGGAIDAGLQFIHLIKDAKRRGTSGVKCTEMLWSELLNCYC